MTVAGSLLAYGAADPDLKLVWRAYWQHRWHAVPSWPSHRLSGFLDAARGHLLGAGGLPHVLDFPDGRAPFLGVLTLGADGSQQAAPDSGVVQYPSPGHLLTVAPTRTGKGACHIIPNLLLYAGSAFVVDVKGENYSITSRFRAAQFDGAKVLRFAPFEADTDRYNPLAFVRCASDGGPSEDTFDDARLLAEMLVPAKAKEEYWDIESRNLVTMLVMYVAIRFGADDPDRCMAMVADLLFRADDLGEQRNGRSEADDDDEQDREKRGIDIVMDEIADCAAATRYVPLMALVTGFREHEQKVRSNILSSCRAEMAIWNSAKLRNATSRSDFAFSDLKASMCRPSAEDPAPTTLYVVIPPEYLHSYRSVVRMMVGLATVELTRPGAWSGKPGWKAEPPCPVMFLLDELPILGHMAPIVNGLSYLAGYGVQIWSFVQNLGQLKQIYGESWHNFPANAAVTTFFGVNDPDTAEYVVRLLGESEETEDRYWTMSTSESDSSSRGSSSSYTSSLQGGSNSGSSDSRSSGSSTTNAEQVRFYREPLARASEVRALDPRLQVVFMRNTPPILSTKLPYYAFPLFDDLYGAWSPTAKPA